MLLIDVKVWVFGVEEGTRLKIALKMEAMVTWSKLLRSPPGIPCQNLVTHPNTKSRPKAFSFFFSLFSFPQPPAQPGTVA